MKYRILKETIKIKQAILANEKALNEALLDAALKIPEISDSYNKYNKYIYENSDDINFDQKSKIAYNEFLNVLEANGYNSKIFKKSFDYSCPYCKDKFLCNGKICRCTKDLYMNNLLKACDISKKAPFTFKDSKLDLIKNEKQKNTLEKIYLIAKTYCEKYPKVKTYNLTFSGNTGTGKSCLASAMANEFINKGRAALFYSSFEINSIALKYHTTKNGMNDFISNDIFNCDLLVIDDLGTEPLLNNVTVQYLLLILEERLNKKLTTVITTNLNSDQILNKYGERIFSRIFDKAHSKFYSIEGKDLRIN